MDTGPKSCAVKTDLNLLLDCLKYQMNCPDLQKQAIFTIYSICQQKEEVINYFRDIGGIQFVYNLSQSSKHTEVQEAALFSLGAMAESSVFCQQDLCVVGIFSDLTRSLVQDFPQSLKRTVVYLVSVLVTKSRAGQMLAKATGCIDALLKIFSKSFPGGNSIVGAVNATELYQLWAAVSGALCSCVNNPQNEENQQLCTSTFPVVKMWLQEFNQPMKEMVQPICSLVAMIVANNSCAQVCFASVGGLDALAQCVLQLVPESRRNPLARETAVAMTRALCACISESAPLASALAQQRLVPQFLALLSCPSLHPADQLCIILTLGHCTQASEAHQYQFVQSGGLSHLIKLLAESQDEELKKGATFVLQSCRLMTKVLCAGGSNSPSQADPRDLGDPNDLQRNISSVCDLESYQRSAQEMLQKIKCLERGLAGVLQEGVIEGERGPGNSTDKWHAPPQWGVEAGTRKRHRSFSVPSPVKFYESTPYRKVRGRKDGTRRKSIESLEGLFERGDLTPIRPIAIPQKGTGSRNDGGARDPKDISCSEARDRDEVQTGRVRRQIFQSTTEQGEATSPQQIPTSSQRPGTGSGPPQQVPQPGAGSAISGLWYQAAGTQGSAEQGGVLCSMCRLRLVPEGPSQSLSAEPCEEGVSHHKGPMSQTGPVKEIQSKPHIQDHMSLCSETHDDKISMILKTPAKLKQQISYRCSGPNLTPLNNWGSPRTPWRSTDMPCISLTPLKESQNTQDKRVNQEHLSSVKKALERESGNTYWAECPQRRERKDFTEEEVQYLMDGVRKLGPSWNSILWSYSFQNGRTNVDLAKKYRRLQNAQQLAVDASRN
ncbi:telomere repeats-binding bouquet formation protein 1 isoform X3 [Brienomyrus brachyistius]|uniref:telomere repeats-binding bouquet formation protein 1 isoform X3 n=1 Tax=Brienomyrus brachyistius TaxID=42636 RepID=UPI0020B43D31|nr:telomere repeats-binding bouquet formation protein 1 isoform X3 [Brienomyrus brachyistius]